jgi:hypothetical protein
MEQMKQRGALDRKLMEEESQKRVESENQEREGKN